MSHLLPTPAPSPEATLERLAHEGWPALSEQLLDGWILYSAGGFTNRANCVWAPSEGHTMTVENRIVAVQEHYAARGRFPIYQYSKVTRPATLADDLEARGYRPFDESMFMTSDLSLTRFTAESSNHRTPRVHHELTSSWLDAWCEILGIFDNDAAVTRRILDRVKRQSIYVMATTEGVVDGVGRGVLHDGWLGIFNMATRLDARRRGIGQLVLRALCDWGISAGARHGYLQVDGNNLPARTLYAKVGFAASHEYHYLAHPNAVPRADWI